MRFLCLHGALGNQNSFSIQLAPLEEECLKDDVAVFTYMNAPIKVEPPEGFEYFFGVGPHYRWYAEAGEARESMIERIRKLPIADGPEEAIRALLKGQEHMDQALVTSRRQTLDLIHATLEADPSIEGIVGYSEGCCLAATVILDEIQRQQEAGRPRRVKCAVFFTGWPPMSPSGKPLLGDESTQRLDVPTLHVIGANDPYKNGALALYNMCGEGTATLFDTGGGHTIPRAGRVIPELGVAVREMISRAKSC